jgi:hypothetical protein
MSEKAFPLIFAFFHLYKCGGSTFNQILESNFPRTVLYAETSDHLLSGQKLGRRRKRLEKQPVEIYLNSNAHFKALSSHLASPDIASLALQPLTIIRNPYSRMMSAFLFDKKLKNIRSDASFDEYASNRVNEMSKRLQADQPPKQPLFYCVLEMFDESLILLERMMYLNHGVQVDLSYLKRLNVSSARGSHPSPVGDYSRFKNDNSVDHDLYEHAVQFIASSSSSIPEWDKLASDYKRRKAKKLQNHKDGLFDVCPSGNNPEQCILF